MQNLLSSFESLIKKRDLVQFLESSSDKERSAILSLAISFLFPQTKKTQGLAYTFMSKVVKSDYLYEECLVRIIERNLVTDYLTFLSEHPSLYESTVEFLDRNDAVKSRFKSRDLTGLVEDAYVKGDINFIKVANADYSIRPLRPELRVHFSIRNQDRYVLDKLLSVLDENGKIATVYIDSIIEPRLLLRDGIIPHPSLRVIGGVNIGSVLSMLYQNYTNDEIVYWLNFSASGINGSRIRNVNDLYNFWDSIKLWSSITKSYAKDYAAQANSIPLLFTFPDMLYSSDRPKTDMSIFQTPTSQTYSDVVPSGLRVTRYAAGMSKGLYYRGDSEDRYCGTFYYTEPESRTILTYKTILVSFNKVTACQELLSSVTDPELKAELEKSISTVLRIDRMLDWIEGRIPSDFSYTPQDVILDFPSHVFPPLSDLESNKKHYIGNHFLYAAEDSLDQILCKTARLLGYEIVHLTHMVGSHQIVEEIMDTRSRQESFDNLHFYEG